jgi:hypothetical protein
MAYSGTVTVTGAVGPAEAITAGVFTGVRSFSVDIEAGMLSLILADGRDLQIAISAATTFTVTISSGNYTVAIS